MCHYELARDRPQHRQHLTEYFLWMSVGGVLGGMFNALVAPIVFPHAYEYPIALVVACLLIPRLIDGRRSRRPSRRRSRRDRRWTESARTVRRPRQSMAMSPWSSTS